MKKWLAGIGIALIVALALAYAFRERLPILVGRMENENRAQESGKPRSAEEKKKDLQNLPLNPRFKKVSIKVKIKTLLSLLRQNKFKSP